VRKDYYYCDGCGRALKGEDLKKATALTVSFNQAGLSTDELFCPGKCMEFAKDYCVESMPVKKNIMDQASRSFENYRRSFFQRKIAEAKNKPQPVIPEKVHASQGSH
jgi:hypothetical protein